MLKLRKTRRALGMTAAALALAGGTAVITAGTANAAGGSQDLSTANCSGYVSYTDNQAYGAVASRNGTLCEVNITQNGGSLRQSYTWGGWVYTPTYWHGWGSNGTWLSDRICVVDHGNGAANCRTV
ncbi:hypothetical protein [Streptomyces sp. NPDC059708]|uniref:hypothetical protein n=1 Tax=Streptomyces sp. NPDC059708 TaxID=3346916 RepID=UPI0036845880